VRFRIASAVLHDNGETDHEHHDCANECDYRALPSWIERCSEQFCGPVNKQMSFACHTFLIALTSLLISIVANVLFALIAKRLPRIPPNQCEPAHIERDNRSLAVGKCCHTRFRWAREPLPGLFARSMTVRAARSSG